MSPLQQLLLRALIAAPGASRCPVRWCAGARALNDRFMLPYYAWADFQDVLADLRDAGYD